MNIRELNEKLEAERLAPWAMKSAMAVREKQEEPCPLRMAYQRDRDRIVHSKSFRRLKHKTQVYITADDHYRTRLTHSLEVAQISRTIARSLRLNEDLTEAIALGHDVGHTPFSHVGEETLRAILGSFAHNEQSWRMVEYIEKDWQGLNLTMAVKDGILHHTGNVLPSTLEGKIVRIADRIAYLCHDLDDSLRSGMLTWELLPRNVVEKLGRSPSAMITTMVNDIVKSSLNVSEIKLSPQIEQTMNLFRKFMFKAVYHSPQLELEREQASFIVRELFRYYKKHFEKLPPEFIAQAEKWGNNRIVADYIAGLTDNYAVLLFKEIYIPPVWNR